MFNAQQDGRSVSKMVNTHLTLIRQLLPSIEIIEFIYSPADYTGKKYSCGKTIIMKQYLHSISMIKRSLNYNATKICNPSVFY